MAVASGPAGLVLARPVLTVLFTPAHVQVINNRGSAEQSTAAATRQSGYTRTRASVNRCGKCGLETGLKPRPLTGPLQKCLLRPCIGERMVHQWSKACKKTPTHHLNYYQCYWPVEWPILI